MNPRETDPTTASQEGAPIEPQASDTQPPDNEQSQVPEPAGIATPVEPTPDAVAPTEAGEEDFDALLEQYDQVGEVESGDLVQGTVVSITSDSVLIDLGDKTEGIVPKAEFVDATGELTCKEGDKVDILVLRRDPETEQMIASRRRAVVQAALATLEAAFAGDDAIAGKIVKVVKNGVIVDLGLECYMPASHIDIRRIGNLEEWVGREVEVMVLELQKGRKRAVVSRRSLLESRMKEEREKFFAATQVDQEITGVVKNITEFGVFVDLGGFDGLIARDEMSWERGLSPADLFQPGEEITARVISMNPETGKIGLSRKRLIADPWITIEEKYPVGQTVPGVVVNTTEYGAFVRLEEGLTGLIHASDMSWSTGRKRPADFVKTGDNIKVRILEVDSQKRRLSLGLKQITPDPWAELEVQYPVGKKIKGKVTSVTNFGIFVEVAPTVEGLIHQSDLAWDRRNVDPTTVAKEGDEIEAVILKIDRVNHKISLGHKHLKESPYVEFSRKHPVGSHVTGKVTRIVSFGAFVQISDNVEGLVHISHLEERRVERVEDVIKVGEEVKVKVLKIDAQAEKINLSRRGYMRDVERREVAQYTKSKTHGGHNLGEALRAAGLSMKPTEEIAPEPKAEETKPEPAPEPEAPKAEEPQGEDSAEEAPKTEG